MASDYAVALGKRTLDNIYSMNWFYGFLKRWPELNVICPSHLSEKRARCANELCLNNYFVELTMLMKKYNLIDKPQHIYKVDKKGINTEVRPPNFVSGKACKPQAIMAERSKTITVIGGGTAMGQNIPPFFLFPGERFIDSLMKDNTPGRRFINVLRHVVI